MPCIIHFISSFLTARPWVENSMHSYKEAWIAYQDCTPWNVDPIKELFLKML